jgi:hypothetical protein
MSTALTTRPEAGFLIIDTFDQAMKVAEYINKSALVPDAYRGKPADIVIAMQYGMELGLSPMQALWSVALINGKPNIYGDALPAVAMTHPAFEDIDDPEPEGNDPEKWIATCTAKRHGRSPKTRTFSTQDAKTAKLWGKAGPWSTNPKVMLMMRARAFALRAQFPDKLKGIITAEEAIDITPVAPAISEPRRLSETAPAPSAPPVAPVDAAAVPTSPTPAAAVSTSPATATTTGVQLTTGVKIEDTKVAVDPKNPKQTTYEVYAKKANAVVCFLTHDKSLYDQAASCEGTDHLFTISYTRGRHQDKPAFIMTGITLEERDDATPTPEQGTLPTEGA